MTRLLLNILQSEKKKNLKLFNYSTGGLKFPSDFSYLSEEIRKINNQKAHSRYGSVCLVCLKQESSNYS